LAASEQLRLSLGEDDREVEKDEPELEVNMNQQLAYEINSTPWFPQSKFSTLVKS
jgi:hypothetical protein